MSTQRHHSSNKTALIKTALIIVVGVFCLLAAGYALFFHTHEPRVALLDDGSQSSVVSEDIGKDTSSKGIGKDISSDKKPQVSELRTFDSASQYLFISDRSEKKIVVYDTYSNSMYGEILLKAIPDIVAISPVIKKLFYIERGTRILHSVDLRTLARAIHELDFPVSQLRIRSDGQWITYSGASRTGVLNVLNGRSFSLPTQGDVSFIFLPNSERLFVGELSNGRLWLVDVPQERSKNVADLGVPISELSVMPNGMALFFSANGLLQRYDLLEEKLEVLDIPVAFDRPHVTSDSRKLLLLSKTRDELSVVNTYTLATEATYSLPRALANETRHFDTIYSGWLDKRVVVRDKKQIINVNLDSDAQTIAEVPDEIESLFIHADSKTMFVLSKNTNTLIEYNIKEGDIVNKYDIPLSSPDGLIMAQSNTLCH